MDIVTHTMTGLASSTVIFSQVARRETFFREFILVLLVGGLGSVLPDLDAISLWSGFDETIGKWLGLSHSGNTIYFSNFFYSHHNMMHSLCAAFLFSSLTFFLFLNFIKAQLFKRISKSLVMASVMFSSYLMHLLGDLPTPACVWGGIKLFWPSTQAFGGYGKIWWWNNYDVFLLAFLCFGLNSLIIIVNNYFRKIDLKILPILLFLLFGSAILYQVNNRGYDFAYEGFTRDFNKHEAVSKAIQKRKLGPWLYNIMEKFDQKLPVHF